MKKIIFGFALCVLLFALSFAAEAQQPKKVPRIGYVSGSGAPTNPGADVAAFRQGLRDLGYTEGKDILVEYRYAEGMSDRMPSLVAELVQLKVDVVVLPALPAIRAAKQATKTIPIVMITGGSDPVKAGLVDSLARPGGNVTGLTNLISELGGKRLELLKEAVPKLSRVAVLYDPAYPQSLREVKELLPADARALKLTIQPWEIRAVDDFDKVFAALNKQRPDGLYAFGAGREMRPNRKRIAEFALKSRLPSVNQQQRNCRSWWPHVLQRGHRGQLSARRILRGPNPQGSQACRSACGATYQVRAGDKPQNREANWPDDPAERDGAGGQGHKMTF